MGKREFLVRVRDYKELIGARVKKATEFYLVLEKDGQEIFVRPGVRIEECFDEWNVAVEVECDVEEYLSYYRVMHERKGEEAPVD